MNKKGIFATILVVQLLFLVILTISVVEHEKINFEYDKEYRRLAAYRINALYEDVEEGMAYLDLLNADTTTKNTYINYITTDFSDIHLIEIEFNGTYLKIYDSNLEIGKEGWL
jgi:hypothetical protein